MSVGGVFSSYGNRYPNKVDFEDALSGRYSGRYIRALSGEYAYNILRELRDNNKKGTLGYISKKKCSMVKCELNDMFHDMDLPIRANCTWYGLFSVLSYTSNWKK